MKKLVPILTLLFLLGCQDDKRARNSTEESGARTEIPADGDSQTARGEVAERPDTPSTDSETVTPDNSDGSATTSAVGGRYRKLVQDVPASDCSCNCIDIAFGEPTEWCIVEDKVYINARCEKTGPDSAEIFFVGASRDANAGRELPWDDFDTTTPIAMLTFGNDGTAELDWLGFSVNGEIATDYAIYGKKTLEGKYVRD